MQKDNLAPAATNVAVLLTFFTRTETLRQTFDVIRRARPARLFLYQDGPRCADELSKIEAARQIVADEQIDWQCDVRRSYHYTNSGAWASTYESVRPAAEERVDQLNAQIEKLKAEALCLDKAVNDILDVDTAVVELSVAVIRHSVAHIKDFNGAYIGKTCNNAVAVDIAQTSFNVVLCIELRVYFVAFH